MSPIMILVLLFMCLHSNKNVYCFNFEILKYYMNEKFLNSATIIVCSVVSDDLKTFQKTFRYTRILSLNNSENVSNMNWTNNNYHEGVILQNNCEEVDDFLRKCSQANLFDSTHHWLIFTQNLDILSFLNGIELNINCDLTLLFENNERNGKFDIFDVYNPASQHGGTLKYKKIGQYNDESGYEVEERGLKYSLRRNMSEVNFRALVALPVKIDQPLMEYLHYDKQREINTFNRFHATIMFLCRDYYNFSLKGLNSTDSWGYLLPNRSFDGMVGALERREIDVGFSCLFLRSDRLEKIDYGRRTWTLRVAFLFRNPKVPTSFMIFLKPLSLSVWLATFLVFILSFFLFIRICESEQKYSQNLNKIHWSEVVVFIIGTVCQQGTTVTSYFLCGKIVTIFVFILSLLIYQFYSASIVSTLLMKPISPINTVQDLINSKMECRSENVLYNKDYFDRARDKLTLDMYHNKLTAKNNVSYFIPSDEGLELIARGGFAFNVELATAYPLIEKSFPEDIICELKEIQLMSTQQMFSNFQKKSPFRKMFDVRVQRMAEVGILHRELTHWQPRKPKCMANTLKFNIGIEDLYPAFVFLLIGIIISFSLLIMEIYLNVRKTRQQVIRFPFVKKKLVTAHAFPQT